MDKENKLILYKDDEGKVNVNVRFADEDVWLTQAQLAEIYNTTQQNISLHQKGIYADGELDESVTHKKYLLVRQEGKRQVQREIDHYNLDMIIALGYRVQSSIAVRFRRWATPWMATALFPTKKPLKRLSESLKSIVSEKCDS